MKTRAAQEAGASYEQALNAVFDKKLDDAEVKFAELAKSGPAGYALLAGMQYAATSDEQGKSRKPSPNSRRFPSAMAPTSCLRSFATLQAAALRVGEADYKEMQNRLEPLIKDGKPWRLNALELLGVAAIKAGQADEAKASFRKDSGRAQRAAGDAAAGKPENAAARGWRERCRCNGIGSGRSACASKELKAAKSSTMLAAAGAKEAVPAEGAPASTK